MQERQKSRLTCVSWYVVLPTFLTLIIILRFSTLSHSVFINWGGVLFNQANTASEPYRLLNMASRYFSAATTFAPNADTFSYLGKSLYLAADYRRSEDALRMAIHLGDDNVQSFQMLASVLAKDNRYEEASSFLLSYLQFDPLNSEVLYKLDELYRMIGKDFSGQENQLSPGESIEVLLSLKAIRPRWLTVGLLSETVQPLQVSVNGEPINKIASEVSGSFHVERFLLENEINNEVHVTVTNIGTDPLELSFARLEYLLPVERYEDVTDATWTSLPHKVIRPGSEYVTYLYHPAHSQAAVKLVLFDHPDRYLTVSINDTVVDNFVGGVRNEHRRGGLTTFTYPIALNTPELVKVRLYSSEETRGGVGIHLLYLTLETN